jgi:hypothetical protein
MRPTPTPALDLSDQVLQRQNVAMPPLHRRPCQFAIQATELSLPSERALVLVENRVRMADDSEVTTALPIQAGNWPDGGG